MLTSSRPASRGTVALRGIVAAVVGIALMAWPGITLGTVVVLFCVVCFSDAAFSALRAVAGGIPGRDRVLAGIRAAVGLGAGIVALAHPDVTVSFLTVVIGIYAIVVGIDEVADARGNGWLVLSGCLSLLAGIALVVWPGIGAVTLAVVFGASLTVAGVALLVAAAAAPARRAVAHAAA
jgi:uncharacterized membrane protein HdeD (DUF308 family)